jgi:uncharacterized protein YutE (UPF0331/DUF86 family)
MSHEDYRVLAARIRAELEHIERIVDKAERAALLIRQHPVEDVYVDAAAHNLHDFYSALERLFLHIAKVVDRSVPDGDRWHRDLLEQMCLPMSAVRPAVLQAGTVLQLDEYLRFRHVVRNVYSFHIDPQRVVQLVTGMRPLFRDVAEQIRQFAQMLEQWSSEAARE